MQLSVSCKYLTFYGNLELFEVARSQPGLGWLKDYSFHLLPYMAIAWRLVTSGWGRPLDELSFWVWGSGNVALCLSHSLLSPLLLCFTTWLGRTQSRSPLELCRRPSYVLLLNLVLFVDFEFSLDLCFFGILDRLSSMCFGAHQLSDVGVGEWGEAVCFRLFWTNTWK
jgi:hypothetical protein